MQGLMKFHSLLLKILRKQKVTDGRTHGRTDHASVFAISICHIDMNVCVRFDEFLSITLQVM